MTNNGYMPLSRKASDLVLPTTTAYYPNLVTATPAKSRLVDWILFPPRRKHLLRVAILSAILGGWVVLTRSGRPVRAGWDDFGITRHGVTADNAEQPASGEKTQQHSPVTPAESGRASSIAAGLLEGLVPLEENVPNPTVHSVLGEEAENAYIYGSRTLEDYQTALSIFIDKALPAYLQPTLQSSLKRYTDNSHPRSYLKDETDRLPGLGELPGTRNIWQTDAKSEHAESAPVASWKDNGEGWNWKLLNDEDAARYVAKNLKESRLKLVWDLLPSGILVRFALSC